MTKLNYNVNIPTKKEEEKKEMKVNKSLNSLSKQAVINESLSYRMPQNVPMGSAPNPYPVKSNGFGRTM